MGEVADTILQQLGGRRFTAMTGAKNLVAGSNSLTMTLPANSVRLKANRMTIRLDVTDTYTLIMARASIKSTKNLSTREGVYSDNLKETFTKMTGLYLTL